MKNKTVVWMLAILLLPAAAHAQRKKINLVGTLGMATGNIEGLIVNMGIEMEVFQNFYAQVSFDNFFQGGSTMAYVREGQVSFPQTMHTRVFGMNLLATYKIPFSRQFGWFFKGGLSYTHQSRYSYDDYYWGNYGYYGYGGYGGGYGGYYDYYPESYYSEETPQMRTGLSYALGTGIEHRFSEKLALIVGGTYESLVDQTLSAEEVDKPGDWVKIYVGISYRLK